ncbi:piggyBac transposable element-derived protein 4-like [Hyperolius riggenbachi]|uniref:piggyBac transposable element-derived protein 4-like n=1 Tax=Hyperolius riggenbachi TaxID=752182 RepID=UPI0035A394B7
MAKRLYTVEEACAYLQQSSESEEGSSGSEWIPFTDSELESLSDSYSESEESEPPTRRVRVEGEAQLGDSSLASEQQPGPSNEASGSGQGSARRRPRVSQLPPEMINAQWSPPCMVLPDIPAFTAASGILVPTENLQPADFFALFIDESILQHIVQQSNLYATQYISDNPTTRFAARWTPTNVPELKVFIGLTLNMGLEKKPQLCDYWARNPIICMPVYAATMKRERYEMLIKCLHFNDNTQHLSRDDPAHDRLFKLRPLLSHLSDKFKEVYMPGKNIVVDESLMSFHGRLGFRQYIPSKRARYGIKFYKLCESGTGYTFDLRVYEGKDSHLEVAGCPPYMCSTGKIVIDLISPLLNKGYHLYIDNFYVSVPLFKFLYAAQTVACGTARPNRQGLPPEVVNKKLKKGEVCSLRSNELLALKFREKRDVLMLTTIHNEATTTALSRREEIQKPVAIVEYTKNMGGVDLADKMLALYQMQRKRKAWYKKVAMYLFQIAMHNSFVVYKKSGNKASYLKFQRAVIASLIYESGYTSQRTGQQDSEEVMRLCDKHFIAPLPPNPGKQNPQKRCRVCARHQIRRDSRYYCPTCPSRPGLCLIGCFEAYHSVLNY